MICNVNISNPFSKPFFISQVALVASDGGEIAGVLHLSVKGRKKATISETLALRIS